MTRFLHQRKRNSGFSLPTIVMLGVIASLWMLGTASLVVPATARLTAERTADLARCSAEAGLDYALRQLNDPTTRDAMLNSDTYTIPDMVMADYKSASNPPTRFSGTITLSNVRPPFIGYADTPSSYTSYLYDSTVDDQNTASALYQNGQNNNMWRVLTAEVSNGITSRAVRVILKPVVSSTSITTTSQVNGTPIPIFSFGAFGIGSIGGNGNTTVNSYNSNINPFPSTYDTLATAFPGASLGSKMGTPGYGDLGSNGNANMNGNANVGGNLLLYGNSNAASGTANVNVSGGVQSVSSSGSFNGASNWVESQGDALTPKSMPPTPAQPSNPTPLPGGGSSINLSGKQTLTLTAGNYVVNSISITGQGRLIVDNSSGPVNIWVQGNSSTGINIGGNGVSNTTGVASNLRIWYPGSQNVQIGGNGDFTGTVFAPNAAVTASGNGAINGAAVGYTVNLNGNGGFHYDRALMTNSQLTWTPLVTVSNTTVQQYLRNFQAVSWHEFNPNSNL